MNEETTDRQINNYNVEICNNLLGKGVFLPQR